MRHTTIRRRKRSGLSFLDALVVGVLFLVAGALWLSQVGGWSGVEDALYYVGGRAHEVSRAAP